MTKKTTPIYRGIDVGYGHVKWTNGESAKGLIDAQSFPSQAPISVDADTAADFLKKRDTFSVPVGDRIYEVGRQVNLLISSHQEMEQLDEQFALSDAYTARMYGALNYMLPGLGADRRIDVLVLGLPMTTLTAYRAALETKFTGSHIINVAGDTVTIGTCKVHPQPLGSYALYLHSQPEAGKKPPMSLIVDPGYVTVDWFVCEGLTGNMSQSRAVNRGVSAYLRAVAKSVIKAHSRFGASESEIVRILDRHFTKGDDFHIAGNDIDLKPHLAAGEPVIEQAAQAIRDSIGAGSEIRLILLTGGGASLYAQKIREKFPSHKVEVMPDSPLANARGFHVIAHWIGASASRAENKFKKGV